jgi:hypothetical protein
MSFLYPLFLAGIAAVGIPIILHLIRRQTRKRIAFSSLMFLHTTMPRFKSRSRLENVLLLILRCIIVCLLAFAFARPFLPKPTEQAQAARARRIALLVDTSASMRRAGIWSQAVNEARSVLQDVGLADRVCVMSFDQGTRTLVGFDQWQTLDPSRRASMVAEQISKLSPGWALTDVGNALVTAAEAVEDDEAGDGQQDTWTHEMVLISDMQQGSSLEALHAYQWPEHIELTVKLVPAGSANNATVQVVTPGDDPLGADGRGLSHVRITNSPNATVERFSLHWADAGPAGPSDQAIEVYVPAGHSSVVRIPAAKDGAAGHRLVLTGDDQDFDNTFYLAPDVAQKVNILYIGNDEPNNPHDMLYYARRAFGTSGAVDPNLVARPSGAVSQKDIADAHLIIAAGAIGAERGADLRRYLESGGTILLVTRQSDAPDAAATMANLAGIGGVESEEADVEGYAMLGQMNFEHPLLAIFSEPRFADFTQIHFWKYRRITVPARGEGILPLFSTAGKMPAGPKAGTASPRAAGARVLAAFDNGDPALFELNIGKGSLLVLTSGWHPSDSQLALSSKFVPLLYSILDYGGALLGQRSQYFVGEPVPVRPSTGSGPAQLQIRRPDGMAVPLDESQKTFTQTDLPGIYTIDSPLGSQLFAVNLSPKECQTAVMPIEDIESLGVSVKQPSIAVAQRQERTQSPDTEQRLKRHRDFAALESEQKLWRWVFVLLLAFSLVEIGLAGWLTRTPSTYEGERT